MPKRKKTVHWKPETGGAARPLWPVPAAAALGLLALSMDMEINSFKESLHGNSIFYVIGFAALVLFLKPAFSVRQARICKYAAASAALAAWMQIAGSSLELYKDFSGIGATPSQFFKNLIVFAGYGCLFYGLLAPLYAYFLPPRLHAARKRAPGFIRGGHTTLLICWALIFLAWLPYFLALYPGALSWDSLSQIRMAAGLSPLEQGHPLMHTLFIRMCLWAGGLSGGGLMAGVAVYTVLQMLGMSLICAYAVYKLCNWGRHWYLRLGALLYFALFPIHGHFSVIMWKDPLFSCSVLLFTVLAVDWQLNPGRYLSARSWLGPAGALLLVMTMKDVGPFVVLLSLPALFAVCRPVRRQMAAAGAACVLVFAMLSGPLSSILEVQKGSPRNALSIPLQQVARVVKYHGDEIDAEHYGVIHSLLSVEGMEDVENIGDLYNPVLSDPVKNRFQADYFAQHKGAFFRTWFLLFWQYPLEYAASFFCNSYGYWYPEVHYETATLNISKNELGLEPRPVLPGLRSILFGYETYNLRYIPLVSMLYSIGFHFHLLAGLAALVCIKRRYRALTAFAPVFVLWLTCLASPVYAEFRYSYGLFLCAPVLIAFVIPLDFHEAGPPAAAPAKKDRIKRRGGA